MKEELLKNLDNPKGLERLYRENRSDFKKAFRLIYPDFQQNITMQVWQERLNFEKEEISWGTAKETAFAVAASLIAGFIANLPEFTSLNPDFFYPRNIAFIFLPLLTAYFAWKQKIKPIKIFVVSIAVIISAVYINLLPGNDKNDTLILACIHLPLFIWALLGFAFTGDQYKNYLHRVSFLRYNGDLVVMTTLFLIAGAVLGATTGALFSLIGIHIENYYFKNIVIWALASSPIIGTCLIQSNPQLVNKVSPVIAKVFAPIVLVTLIAYLIAIIYTGKDPYNDREFLLIFNLLLIGVMAIILFSIAGTTRNSAGKTGMVVLLALAIVTIIVNGIALSAILFRISQWGITPNRLAVTGGNVLILSNLLIVAFRLFKAIKERMEATNVEKSIGAFLPVYIIWTMVVTFIFPLLFNFK